MFGNLSKDLSLDQNGNLTILNGYWILKMLKLKYFNVIILIFKICHF